MDNDNTPATCIEPSAAGDGAACSPIDAEIATPADTSQPASGAKNPDDAKQPDAAAKSIMWTPGSYLGNQFFQDVHNFKAYSARKTGFPTIDQQQSLYPGFYVLGALPSLGKTTFAHQMAEQLASRGELVLYFSLEQSAFELFSKGLSRRMNQRAKADSTLNRYTAVQIRQGDAIGTREIIEAKQDYLADVGNNLVIVEGVFSMTVEHILGYCKQIMDYSHRTPVVIIDYLQIISASNPRADSRQKIDHIVAALKHAQVETGMTIIAICSVNRANYLLPIDFESYKESGGIEYTADVVWGLQMAIIDSDRFNTTYDSRGKASDTSIINKRAMLNAAKCADIRDIQLVCLKNRYGTATYKIDLRYEPRYDTFECALAQGLNITVKNISAPTR